MALLSEPALALKFIGRFCIVAAVVAFAAGSSIRASAQQGREPIPAPVRAESPRIDDQRLHLAQVAPANVTAEETRRAQYERAEQIKIIGEINRLTVEIYKRHTDPTISKADTPTLVKRLKELAKRLPES